MKRLCGGLVLAASLLATPALAANDTPTFRACDGYGPTSKTGDGMLTYSGFVLFKGPRMVQLPTRPWLGQQGVAACTTALGLPALTGDHWRRRANLLTWRAMHRLALNDAEGALADLDLARQTLQEPSDPFLQRSQGINIDLVRAWALRNLGRSQEAADLAMAAWTRRPYSRQVGLGALAAMGPQARPADLHRLNARMAAINPAFVSLFFEEAGRNGRYQEVIDLYPQLSPPREDVIDGWTGLPLPEQVSLNELRRLTYLAQRTGPYGYALAALGRTAEARTTMAAMLAQVQREVDRPDAKINYAAENQIRQTNLARDRLKASVPDINRWAALVEQRVLLAEGRIDEVYAWAVKDFKPIDAAGIELVEALARKLTPQQAAALPPLAAARAAQANPVLISRGDLNDLRDALLPAESARNVSAFRDVKVPFMAMKTSIAETGADDGRTIPATTGPEQTIMFRSKLSPGPMIEEQALLRAADLARKAGADRFYLLRRMEKQHIVVDAYMRVETGAPLSYQSDVTVIFVRPGEAPAVAPWRLLVAQEVIDVLGPLYLDAPEPKS